MRLIDKISKAHNEGGLRLVGKRIYVVLSGQSNYFRDRNKIDGFKEILIISGCYLEHPKRYRSDHQREQLSYCNISSDEIFVSELTMEMVCLFRSFLFVRCEHSNEIESFINRAKELNKTCIFDIDDLIFDRKYVSDIEYVNTLPKIQLANYLSHVDNLGKMVDLCDHVITTTDVLSQALQERGASVFINGNVASTEMLHLSKLAIMLKNDSTLDEKIRVGYISGSITHNPDIELIEDALIDVARQYGRVEIELVGQIKPSDKLKQLGDQLVVRPSVDWRELPNLISKFDINLAPITDSIFNRAKSANKWLEAAIVAVPTIASNIGAFKDIIVHQETGLLCENLTDWKSALIRLIDEPGYRRQIGENARDAAIRNYSTQLTGLSLVKFIRSKLAPLKVFVIPNLNPSGGMRVILKHCQFLHENGDDVLLFVDDNIKDQYISTGNVEISLLSVRTCYIAARIDIMVATLWTTVRRTLAQTDVVFKAYLVQNYEPDFYEGDQVEKKIQAESTYSMSHLLDYRTISKWCKSWLLDVYSVNAKYVQNGIDVKDFSYRRRKIDIDSDVFRVLVEGNSADEYKNVTESMTIVRQLKSIYGNSIECHYVSYGTELMAEYPVDMIYNKVPFSSMPALYRYCDILMKSSKLESFSYPPLEMMATGGMVVVGANGGNSEYVRHRKNCMVYTIGNPDEALGYIEELLSNVDLRNTLAHHGPETAKQRDWCDLRQNIIDFWSVDAKSKYDSA